MVSDMKSDVNKSKPSKSAKQQESVTSTYTPAQKGELALSSELNNAAVMNSYQENVIGSDVDLQTLVDGVLNIGTHVERGNLQKMEAMLVGQAMALQAIFTDLARKAKAQTYLKHTEVNLSLALKAQAQSRATISALVDLKYPRQSTFVKQANIANGPQQVNNGDMPKEVKASRGKNKKTEQNKLLEDGDGKFSIGVVPGKAATSESGDKAMEAVEPIHRSKKRRR